MSEAVAALPASASLPLGVAVGGANTEERLQGCFVRYIKMHPSEFFLDRAG
ncbi:hypothetical protein LZ198_17835 [Myxococcus sp. K15C18031901]|uniref:hypothetical protein n=1 Tax=Myxococcus dinghuensis TaxID=2906761 RepID=UPI0020A791A7|nr:hypothetical protein [Myxococcus dinghuensis]MCP3100733.1 hypothetical protein [Myxococcus dinghuensis]